MQDQAHQRLKKIVNLITLEIFTYFNDNPHMKVDDAITFILDCMANSTLNIVLSLKRLLSDRQAESIDFNRLMKTYMEVLPDLLDELKNYKPLRDTDIEIH